MSAIQKTQKTKEEIAKAYVSEPWWYDLRGLFILTFAYNSNLWSQIKFFSYNMGLTHLEVACGSGTLLEMFLKWREKHNFPRAYVVGFDYAESMLAGATHRFKSNPNVLIKHADAANLPYPSNVFRTANIANAVHCFPDVNGSFREIFRVLQPKGTLAANVLLYPRGPWFLSWIAGKINVWGISKGILYTPYKQGDIRQKLIDAGFDIVSENVSGNCYNVLCQKP